MKAPKRSFFVPVFGRRGVFSGVVACFRESLPAERGTMGRTPGSYPQAPDKRITRFRGPKRLPGAEDLPGKGQKIRPFLHTIAGNISSVTGEPSSCHGAFFRCCKRKNEVFRGQLQKRFLSAKFTLIRPGHFSERPSCKIELHRSFPTEEDRRDRKIGG